MKMNLQRRESGVALVATLIMLSLVTFMVVAFLGVARREQRSISAVTSANEAKAAMEAALYRAQAVINAQMLTYGNKDIGSVMVPTNYQSPGFIANLVSPGNVNYTNAMAQGVSAWLTNLGNLQYDARPPVFSPNYTNVTPFDPLASETNQGRYYLDFNRDGMFELTDRFLTGDPQWLGILEYPDQLHGPTNRFGARYTYLVAPAGKAMDLNFIHNQAKRGGGLAGAVAAERYYRNLGLGPQEFNLAAMLTELSPNLYLYNYSLLANASSGGAPTTRDAFRDARDLLLFRNNGSANNLSRLNVLFPAAGTANNLVNSQLDVLGNGGLMNNLNIPVNVPVDPVNVAWPGGSNINANAQHYFDVNEAFVLGRPYSTTFTTNLQYTSTNNLTATAAGDRDRRAFYNLLTTVGVDSWPQTDKLNLNWQGTRFLDWSNSYPGLIDLVWTNSPSTSVGGEDLGFTNWPANAFFNTAAELMFRASFNPSVIINTNWTGFGGAQPNVLVTNYYFGTNFIGINAGATLSVTNLPIYPFSYYSPEVHRILQFAANLYDTTTTNAAAPAYPTIFRPFFAFNTNGWPSNDAVRIIGYSTNGTDTSLLSLPIYDLTDPNGRMAMYQDANSVITGPAGTNYLCLAAGTPVILGAKKGYPNFNEFGVQTLFSETRRLEFVKTNATNFGPNAITQTNQSLIIGLTNIYGIEAWNSYAAAFPQPVGVPNNTRQLRLAVTNTSYIVLTNEFGPLYTNLTVSGTNILINPYTWLGTAGGLGSFKSFFFTNVPALSTNLARGYAYSTNYPPLTGYTNGGFIPASPTGPGSPSIFNRSNGFPEMRLGITITNSLVYALYEPNANRVVDFVNLTNLVTGMDLSRALRVTNSAADTSVRFWETNRAGGSVFDLTLGISNQIAMCLDTNVNSQATNLWRQWSLTTPVLREIDRFRRFMGTNTALPINQVPSPGITIQSPFVPTRVISFNANWEVNDPLVHYTTRDLSDPYRVSITDQVTPIIPPVAIAPPPGTLYRVDSGFINGRFVFATNGGYNRFYLPWGRPLDTTGSQLANLTNFYLVSPAAFDQRLKDPGIYNSDQWDFPQRSFGNLGWIGRVHRGTPWQTIYLKSEAPNPTNWFYWAHSPDTSPTNDWRLVDVFTAAINADATRSLLSVNQTNSVAWAALGGTLVLTNNGVLPANWPFVMGPASPQLTNIVGGLTNGLINAKQRIGMWQPTANYSAGDIVGYWFGTAGTAYYRALTAPNAANVGQNPYAQTTANFFGNWTNVYYWNNAATYTAGDVVAHFGVSYMSLINGNVNYLPHANPDIWEPYPKRSFTKMGHVLSTPELSSQSPYLNLGPVWQVNTGYSPGARVFWQGWYYQAVRNVPINQPPNQYLNYADPRTMAQTYWWPLESPAIARNAATVDALNDVFVERIPQQTLGLLQIEQTPRFVIYAYGQSLRPAERGIYVSPGAYQLMATNYQISGEVASRTLVRVEGIPDPGFLPRPLPPGAPPQVLPRFIIESFRLLPSDY